MNGNYKEEIAEFTPSLGLVIMKQFINSIWKEYLDQFILKRNWIFLFIGIAISTFFSNRPRLDLQYEILVFFITIVIAWIMMLLVIALKNIFTHCFLKNKEKNKQVEEA